MNDSTPLDDSALEGVENVVVVSTDLKQDQLVALQHLLQYQCECLEQQIAETLEKLHGLQAKLHALMEHRPVRVCLSELVSPGLVTVAERCLFDNSTSDVGSDAYYNDVDCQAPKAEISAIIDSINQRQQLHSQSKSNEHESENRAADKKPFEFNRNAKRAATLPNPKDIIGTADEVQELLHIQGNCKPCAFFYNKKKGCKNGENCGFCHHQDHSLCSLKQWKKAHKQIDWANSDVVLTRANSEVYK